MTATDGRPRAPLTVEQAYRARQRTAEVEVPAEVERPAAPAAAELAPAIPRPRPPTPSNHPARPPIAREPDILGLSRHTRGRVGSRLFNLFFALVFLLIAAQLVLALLHP